MSKCIRMILFNFVLVICTVLALCGKNLFIGNLFSEWQAEVDKYWDIIKNGEDISGTLMAVESQNDYYIAKIQINGETYTLTTSYPISTPEGNEINCILYNDSCQVEKTTQALQLEAENITHHISVIKFISSVIIFIITGAIALIYNINGFITISSHKKESYD